MHVRLLKNGQEEEVNNYMDLVRTRLKSFLIVWKVDGCVKHHSVVIEMKIKLKIGGKVKAKVIKQVELNN